MRAKNLIRILQEQSNMILKHSTATHLSSDLPAKGDTAKPPKKEREVAVTKKLKPAIS